MNRKIETAFLAALVLCMVQFIGLFSAAAFNVITIVGVVNSSNQIIVEGEIFEVDYTPQGEDLVKNYIGKTVKVTGKLRIEGDMRILEVTKFEMVREIL